MTRPDDAIYFERRAEDQIVLAQKSLDVRAVRAHYQLATMYLDRIYGDDGSISPLAEPA